MNLASVSMTEQKVREAENALEACEIAGIAANTRDVVVDDPIAYVLSLNLHRRQLTPSQLSMVAARARAIYDQQAKERQRASGGKHDDKKAVVANLPQPESTKSRDAAGRAVGVSGKSVDHATRVLANAEPEVIAAVDAGRMAVSSAAVISGDSRDEQLSALKKTKNRVYTSTKQTTDAGTPAPCGCWSAGSSMRPSFAGLGSSA